MERAAGSYMCPSHTSIHWFKLSPPPNKQNVCYVEGLSSLCHIAAWSFTTNFPPSPVPTPPLSCEVTWELARRFSRCFSGWQWQLCDSRLSQTPELKTMIKIQFEVK